MAYIGNKADTAFTSLLKQDLTGASGTSLTLTHAVANANDIALYINNVRQEPTEAYSVNGTTVSLTGSVASTDDIYVIYLARAVQTTVPPDGSVSSAKIANSAVDLTSKVSGILPKANGGTGGTVTGVTSLTEDSVSGQGSATFTVPTTAKIIYIHWNAVSHSGGSNYNMLVQLGDSGGVETSGYISNVSVTGNTSSTSPNATSTSGLIVYYQASSSDSLDGQTTIVNSGGNKFSMSSIIKSGNYNNVSAGTKTLSAQITTVYIKFDGMPNFDTGTINVTYVE